MAEVIIPSLSFILGEVRAAAAAFFAPLKGLKEAMHSFRDPRPALAEPPTPWFDIPSDFEVQASVSQNPESQAPLVGRAEWFAEATKFHENQNYWLVRHEVNENRLVYMIDRDGLHVWSGDTGHGLNLQVKEGLGVSREWLRFGTEMHFDTGAFIPVKMTPGLAFVPPQAKKKRRNPAVKTNESGSKR